MITQQQRAAYESKGFVAGLRAFDEQETAALRAQIEALEEKRQAGADGKPAVRQADNGADYAMLARGMDTVQGWINVAPPQTLFAPDDLSRYDEILKHQSAALAQGAAKDVGMYAAKGSDV